MKTLRVHHLTRYRYREPVAFGVHRLMFRPRDSHDMRLLDTRLSISPSAQVRWVHDVFGNSIAFATIEEKAKELVFESEILVEHFAYNAPEFAIDRIAENYPFQYPPDELPDLMPSIERRFSDSAGKLKQWLEQFYRGEPVKTGQLLIAMTHAIHTQFTYRARTAVGTQSPEETLSKAEGACRDYAVLMIEALRSLGFAARFVSGYLYDASAEGTDTGAVGGAATHAWIQVYVPGAGWMEFDPTNGNIGGENLIRVAVSRDPAQAVPLEGSFKGPRDAFIALDVEVEVSEVNSSTLPTD